MAGLPTIRRPGQPRAGLSGRHPVEWARLLLTLALLAVLVVALVHHLPRAWSGSDQAAAPTNSFSALAGGYDGPPIQVAVDGTRTKALVGLCVVIVRDASSSVSSGIDPDGQVNKELAAISEAFARGGLDADRVAAVVFAADATSSGALAAGDDAIRSVLLSSPGEDGTSITAGLQAASDALESCPAGTQRDVILVSDGESTADDIGTGLASLPDGASVHLVALDGGGWPRIAPLWGVTGAEATIIRRLDAGVVALAVNRLMSDLTGQNFATGFDTEGQGT